MPEPGSGWYIIANPVSGGGRGSSTIASLERVLTNLGIGFEITFTEATGHAIELARTATFNGYKKIAIAGGDGTCNEVVNGVLAANDYKPVNTEFAVISSGRGNDWIRTHGIHTDISRAAALLRFGKSVRHDAGLVEFQKDGKPEKRAFINMSGMAIAADTLERSGRFRRQNKLVYLNALIRVLLRYKSPVIRFRINGEEHEKQVLVIITANCRYAGSGMLLAPKADPGDGLLDFTVIDSMSFMQVAGQIPKLFRGGLENHPSVHLHRGNRFEASSENPVLIEADGELLGTTPCSYSIIPGAFLLRVP
ncbi:MAG: diacylglycerol kinase family lipid kinase [Balneolaceae bacterium]|nr:MAG: diacylglycerol kinase family lipid kinase [Balneolaceae bacterium]